MLGILLITAVSVTEIPGPAGDRPAGTVGKLNCKIADAGRRICIKAGHRRGCGHRDTAVTDQGIGSPGTFDLKGDAVEPLLRVEMGRILIGGCVAIPEIPQPAVDGSATQVRKVDGQIVGTAVGVKIKGCNRSRGRNRNAILAYRRVFS